VRELEPGRWYADLDAFPGVWADGTSPEDCLITLADVLHEWLVIKLAHGDRDIPVTGDLDPTGLAIG
jgi:predicted RNase H-like HicB family nuclease